MGEVTTFRYKGDDYEINVKNGDVTLLVHTYTKVSVGQTVAVYIPADKIRIRKREEAEAVEEQVE